MIQLVSVFSSAALPQKLILLILLGSIPVAVVLAAREFRRGSRGLGAALISEMRIAGPALGLLAGAMNAFHMMSTTLRLAASPTAKVLAPGVMEIAALVGFGAFSGVLAVLLDFTLRSRAEMGKLS